MRIDYLKEKGKFGDLAEAHAIATRDAQVAGGGKQSLDFVLQRFWDSLQEAEQALEIGMRNYAEFEAQAEQDFRSLDPEANPLRQGATNPKTGNGLPPMPVAGAGRGGEDTEHGRPSYLIETEDIWGDGRHVAPPVIGDDPPEYHY